MIRPITTLVAPTMAVLFAIGLVSPASAHRASQGNAKRTNAKRVVRTKPQPEPPSKTGEQRADAMADMVLERLHDFADSHWHKGEYAHLVNISLVILEGWPDDIERYADTGWILWSMNRDDEAVALYERGVKASPNTSYMYDELGHYYYNRKKDYKKAISYYEQAAKFNDVQPFTIHLLAHSYERTGQLEKALHAWERAAQMPGPALGAAKMNLDRVRRMVSQNRQSGT